MKIRRSEVVLLVQAAAIVLPVAALTAIALRYLHVDRAEIIATARRSVQAELPASVDYLQRVVQGVAQHGVEAAVKNGQPTILSDYPQVPEPSAGWPEAVAVLRRLEAAEGRGDVVSEAVAVARRYPNAVTESGTPVAGLALLIALRHVKDGILVPELLDELQRNALEFPSFLTPEILRLAGQAATQRSASRVAAIAEEWRKREDEREKMRTIVRTVAARLVGASGPSTVRFPEGSIDWLALCDPAPDGWKIRVAKSGPEGNFPPHVGAMIQLDRDRRIVGAQSKKQVEMVSSNGQLSVPGGHRFLFVLYIDLEHINNRYNRELLFIRGIILCATATALIGLSALWIGYRRQARLSEMKSNFVSSVSHELRAPLAAVRLMAESLEGGRIGEEGKRQDYYRLIVQECRRLSGLVENVLDLSRIGEGRKDYRFEPVDVAALVRQSVALMEPCAAERQVALQLSEDGAGELQAVWDAQAVEQSMVNLLDNAIKHSPEGGEVRIAVERDDGKVRIWVEDRGPGIPAAEQKRIFEMFYRHGSELRRETKGAGIGLTIVQSVAEAHGGRVVLESELGHGSRFGLELPLENRS